MVIHTSWVHPNKLISEVILSRVSHFSGVHSPKEDFWFPFISFSLVSHLHCLDLNSKSGMGGESTVEVATRTTSTYMIKGTRYSWSRV